MQCWAPAHCRKWEGVAVSLQSVIQGRSEREVVLKRVLYSQHSLPKNKTNKNPLNSPTFIEMALFSTEK